ncbi:MAG: peptide chain release factor 1 [Clostridia bacterium]|nr:peptide chain release factor 1 [Clostridia bacterium]
MIERIESAAARCRELEKEMARDDVATDPARFSTIMKEYNALLPLDALFKAMDRAEKDLTEAREILSSESDPEMLSLARAEEEDARIRLAEAEERSRVLLLPRDPNDEKNVIVEIRAGTGGEEAALFCGDLYRMYAMFAQSRGWKCEILDANETELGGFKEISFSVEGENVWSDLKYESGVHRVQRVPKTDSQGRIQTSSVSVVVLPEAEEVDVVIDPQDLVIDTHRASGAGGQHINKTDSAIRILHKPTGIVVECQDERSQLKNKDKAMKVLRTKILELENAKKNDALTEKRRLSIGTGDRSEKIRTYNFPQSRVSDHRIGLTLHSLDAVMNGKLDEIVSALRAAEQKKLLEGGDVL